MLCAALSRRLPAGSTHAHASRRPAIREHPCSAHRSGATLSWHRPQRLHMKTRASLALIRLGPGGADAAAATSPHRLCLRVLAALPEVRFVFIVLALYDVPVLLCSTVCPSARPCVHLSVRLSASSCEQKACFGFYDLPLSGPLLQPVEMSSQ